MIIMMMLLEFKFHSVLMLFVAFTTISMRLHRVHTHTYTHIHWRKLLDTKSTHVPFITHAAV